MQVWYLICSYVGGGVVFAGLVSLASSPYSSELLVSGRGLSVSRDGSVGIATRYRLDSPGIKTPRMQDFTYTSIPALRPTQASTNGYRFIPGAKAVRTWS